MQSSSNAKLHHQPRQHQTCKKKYTCGDESGDGTATGRRTDSIAPMPLAAVAIHHVVSDSSTGHTDPTSTALATDTDILQYLMTELLSGNDDDNDNSWQIDLDILLAAGVPAQQQVQQVEPATDIDFHDRSYSSTAYNNMPSSSSAAPNNSHSDHHIQPYLFQMTGGMDIDPHDLESDLDRFLRTSLPPLITPSPNNIDQPQVGHIKELDCGNYCSASANTMTQQTGRNIQDDQYSSAFVTVDMEHIEQQYLCPPADLDLHKLPAPDDLGFDHHMLQLDPIKELDSGNYGSARANRTHQAGNIEDHSSLLTVDMGHEQQYSCPPAEDLYKLPVPDDLGFDHRIQPPPFDQLLEEAGSFWWNIHLEEADPLWAALAGF